MGNTEKRVDLENPYVAFVTTAEGARLTVEASRRKRDGSYEFWTIVFDDLDPEQLACVGSKTRRALYHIKEKAAERMQAAYDRVITPGQ